MQENRSFFEKQAQALEAWHGWSGNIVNDAAGLSEEDIKSGILYNCNVRKP